MRRTLTLTLMLVVVGMAACHKATGGPLAGADASDAAVRQFLFAVKSQDLQALSAVWGNDVSPVRERMDQKQVERRSLIMMCHLRHDESRIGPAQASEAGRVLHRVDLTQGAKRASPVFKTVRNKTTGRWFVEDFDLVALRSFCANSEPQVPRPDGAGPAAR